MKEIIDVFKMVEIPAKTRARIIIKLGIAINNEHGMSITQPIVYELVKLLDPENSILTDTNFLNYAKP